MEAIPSNPLTSTARYTAIPIGHLSMKTQSRLFCTTLCIGILHEGGIWEVRHVISVKHAQLHTPHAWKFPERWMFPERSTVCRNITRWTWWIRIEKFIIPKPYGLPWQPRHEQRVLRLESLLKGLNIHVYKVSLWDVAAAAECLCACWCSFYYVMPAASQHLAEEHACSFSWKRKVAQFGPRRAK